MKLFCLPYAGGSATIFRSWSNHLEKGIELIPIELSGRGSRSGDPLYRDIQEAGADALNCIVAETQGYQLPYAIFGHSLGSRITYELLQMVQEEGSQLPVHAFFSGGAPPHLQNADRQLYHLMDDAEFKKRVFELGGTPEELLIHPALLKVFLPILKNDFRIVETAPVSEKITPLNMDISVFIGKNDNVITGAGEDWRAHSLKGSHIYCLEGGHFFLKQSQQTVLNIINLTLREYH